MSWERYKKYYLGLDDLGFGLDVSRVDFDDAFLNSMEGKMSSAFKAMKELEAGAIANPDENRMVGHYWLRNAQLAPTAEIKAEITDTVAKIKDFAKKIHDGEIKGADGAFENPQARLPQNMGNAGHIFAGDAVYHAQSGVSE